MTHRMIGSRYITKIDVSTASAAWLRKLAEQIWKEQEASLRQQGIYRPAYGLAVDYLISMSDLEKKLGAHEARAKFRELR